MSSSMSFATIIAVFTPKAAGFSPITYKADVFLNEEECISEPQPDSERARYFAANDGNNGQYIDKYATAGKRDISLFDSPEADKLVKWALSNPQPMFDCAVTYKRNDQDDSQVRTQLHENCKIYNHPVRTVSNDVATLKFSMHYGKLSVLDAAGSPV